MLLSHCALLQVFQAGIPPGWSSLSSEGHGVLFVRERRWLHFHTFVSWNDEKFWKSTAQWLDLLLSSTVEFKICRRGVVFAQRIFAERCLFFCWKCVLPLWSIPWWTLTLFHFAHGDILVKKKKKKKFKALWKGNAIGKLSLFFLGCGMTLIYFSSLFQGN